MKFRVFARVGLRGRRFYFRGIAKNGRTIFQSEGYRNLQDVLDTIDVIREQAMAASLHLEVDHPKRKFKG